MKVSRSRMTRAALAAVFLALIFCGGWILVRKLKAAGSDSGILIPAPRRLDDAIANVQEKLNKEPDNLRAMTKLGLLEYLKGPQAYPKAINDLEDSWNMGALDPRIFYCLGEMYQQLGLYPFALEEYDRYLRNKPKDESVALLEAKILYQTGRYAQAVARYQKLEVAHPQNPIIAENLALSLWKMKQTDQALSEISRMASLGPVAAQRAAFDSAQIAYQAGRYQDALEEFLKAQPVVGDGPTDIPAVDFYRLLARTNQKLGRLEDARNAWAQVLLRLPKDRTALRQARALKRRIAVKRRHKARRGRDIRRKKT
ncbi:MAG: tetratricopeptide repeat protein [Elusimicrobiota bacterium]